MPSRVTVSIPQPLHDFADELVERGTYATVSAAVAAGLNALQERQTEQQAMLDGLTAEIQRRAETPDDQFVLHEAGDLSAILRMLGNDRDTA